MYANLWLAWGFGFGSDRTESINSLSLLHVSSAHHDINTVLRSCVCHVDMLRATPCLRWTPTRASCRHPVCNTPALTVFTPSPSRGTALPPTPKTNHSTTTSLFSATVHYVMVLWISIVFHLLSPVAGSVSPASLVSEKKTTTRCTPKALSKYCIKIMKMYRPSKSNELTTRNMPLS